MKTLILKFSFLPRMASDGVEWRDLRCATIFTLLLLPCFFHLSAQDTFSIVAADSTSRQVGSAGASCVDLFAAGFLDDSFLGDLLPDTGAINTQAFYLPANQNNARIRMRAGDTPNEIIGWLSKHDSQNNPTIRQYGIVGFTGSDVSSAGYTGVNTNNYKNHITGSIDGIYYSIQGNILLNQGVLDAMEANFRNASGDLACRLMAALQGANIIGADTRCAPDETSSLFAFLKVAEPTDAYGSPSLKVSVRTRDNTGIEPIDSLQSIFNAQHNCSTTSIDALPERNMIQLHPNPAQQEIIFVSDPSLIGTTYSIIDMSGKVIRDGLIAAEETSVDIHTFEAGIYFLVASKSYKVKFVKQ